MRLSLLVIVPLLELANAGNGFLFMKAKGAENPSSKLHPFDTLGHSISPIDFLTLNMVSLIQAGMDSKSQYIPSSFGAIHNINYRIRSIYSISFPIFLSTFSREKWINALPASQFSLLKQFHSLFFEYCTHTPFSALLHRRLVITKESTTNLQSVCNTPIIQSYMKSISRILDTDLNNIPLTLKEAALLHFQYLAIFYIPAVQNIETGMKALLQKSFLQPVSYEYYKEDLLRMCTFYKSYILISSLIADDDEIFNKLLLVDPKRILNSCTSLMAYGNSNSNVKKIHTNLRKRARRYLLSIKHFHGDVHSYLKASHSSSLQKLEIRYNSINEYEKGLKIIEDNGKGKRKLEAMKMVHMANELVSSARILALSIFAFSYYTEESELETATSEVFYYESLLTQWETKPLQAKDMQDVERVCSNALNLLMRLRIMLHNTLFSLEKFVSSNSSEDSKLLIMVRELKRYNSSEVALENIKSFISSMLEAMGKIHPLMDSVLRNALSDEFEVQGTLLDFEAYMTEALIDSRDKFEDNAEKAHTLLPSEGMESDEKLAVIMAYFANSLEQAFSRIFREDYLEEEINVNTY